MAPQKTSESQSSILTESKSTSSGTRSGSTDSVKDQDARQDMDSGSGPLDLEANIQADRITKILDYAMYKTKLAICLPELLQEYSTLQGLISQEDLDYIVYILDDQFNEARSESNVQDLSSVVLYPDLRKVIFILIKYKELRPVIDDIIFKISASKMISNFNVTSSIKTADVLQIQASMEYLAAFEEFYLKLIQQLQTTAAEELSNKLLKQRLEIEVARLVKKVADYLETLRIEQEAFEARMDIKLGQIAQLRQELAMTKADAAKKLQTAILKSDQQMVLTTRNHNINQVIIEEEEEESRNIFQTILKAHLDKEKSHRVKRLKAETQVISFVQKFDNEMINKRKDLTDIDEKYEIELRKCEKLKTKIAKQDILYLPLMADRDEEYEKEMTAKMNTFLMDHAARVIQNAWVLVLANRKEKKKLRKILKKIVKEREEAEKKAERARLREIRLAKLRAKEAKQEAKKEALRRKMEKKKAIEEAKLAEAAAIKAAKVAAAKAAAEARAAAEAEAKAAKEAAAKEAAAARAKKRY